MNPQCWLRDHPYQVLVIETYTLRKNLAIYERKQHIQMLTTMNNAKCNL